MISRAAIEAAARELCRLDGGNPDFTVPYEQSTASGLKMRREQPKHGPKRWPEMPLWQWKYEKPAEVALTAALAAEGMALVPVEPTREMLFFMSSIAVFDENRTQQENERAAYAAMLKAAGASDAGK